MRSNTRRAGAIIHIDDACRAQLYHSFARGLSAGLPLERVFAGLSDLGQRRLVEPLRRTSRSVGNGSSLARSLHQQRLLPNSDHFLLQHAENAGCLDQAFERLAQCCERNHARWQRMKSRLALPIITLLGAIVLLPLPALFATRITVTEYMTSSVTSLVLLMLLLYLARKLVSKWRDIGPPSVLTGVARYIAYLSRRSVLHERVRVMEALAIQLRCSVAAPDAINALLAECRNSVHRNNLERVAVRLRSGCSVADALRAGGLVDQRHGFPALSASEQAGRLDEGLTRYAQQLNTELDDGYELLAKWLPVVGYGIVAGIVASGIVAR